MAAKKANEPKAGMESLTDENAIFRAVRNKCFQSPFTVIPLALAAGMLLLTGSFSLGFLGVFASFVLGVIGAAAFVYNMWIRGEDLTREHIRWIMAQLKLDRQKALEEIAVMCREIGFTEGAKEAMELSEAYSKYTAFLETKAGAKLGSAVGERLGLAESARSAGVGHLRQAAEIHVALGGVNVKKLRAERSKWLRESEDPLANHSVLETKLRAHSRQIERYEQLVTKRDEFIALSNELEAALNSAYLSEAGRSSFNMDNNSDNPAVRLSNVVDAAEAAELEIVDFLNDIRRDEPETEQHT